jgi:hypothetical protein
MALYFVIIIWLLVTFRLEDLKWFSKIQAPAPVKKPVPGIHPPQSKKTKP